MMQVTITFSFPGLLDTLVVTENMYFTHKKRAADWPPFSTIFTTVALSI